MKRKRSRIGVFLSILLLAGLLGAAFYVPGMISRIYDNRTLGKVNARKLELSTYQVRYGSFEEKLHAMGMALADGGRFNIVNHMADVEIAEEVMENIRHEATRLFEEELQLNLSMSTYVLQEKKAVSVLCSNPGGEEMLTENQVYIMTYREGEIVQDKVTEYPELYYAVPHITLWVDREFGKIYGFVATGIPQDGLGMNLTIWENSHMDAITNYWGLGEEFALGATEQTVYDSYQKKNTGSILGEENIYMGQDAYLPIYRDVAWDGTKVDFRLGLYPYIYNMDEVGYVIEISN